MLEGVSESDCPPVILVVDTGAAAFTYSLDTEQRYTDLPQLKWHGRLFSLYAISTDKNSPVMLREGYSLNVNNSVTGKYNHRGMEVISHHRNSLSSLKSSKPAGRSHRHVH